MGRRASVCSREKRKEVEISQPQPYWNAGRTNSSEGPYGLARPDSIVFQSRSLLFHFFVRRSPNSLPKPIFPSSYRHHPSIYTVHLRCIALLGLPILSVPFLCTLLYYKSSS
jgi:hypothetical protein